MTARALALRVDQPHIRGMRKEVADTLIRAAEIVGVRRAHGNRTAIAVTVCAFGVVALGVLYRVMRRPRDPTELFSEIPGALGGLMHARDGQKHAHE